MMLILQRLKSTFAMAFSTIFLSSGLVSCGSNGGSGLMPSTSQTQIRTLRSMSSDSPFGSNTCIGHVCYLAFGGSASLNLPVEQVTFPNPAATCNQGSWSPSFAWIVQTQPNLAMSAKFSKQSGGAACGSNVSATITYHDSSPASTPESKAYFAMSWPHYNYTWCLPASEGGCVGPVSASNGIAVDIYVDAPPTPPRASLVYAQAKSRIGFNTSSYQKNIGSPCAYMVNMIQFPVTGIKLSVNVPAMVKQMEANPSVYQQLPATDLSTAVQGDIVVKDGTDTDPAHLANPKNPAQSHVGICANNGCTQIDSNSDNAGQFMNNYHNGPSMDGFPSIIFHVK